MIDLSPLVVLIGIQIIQAVDLLLERPGCQGRDGVEGYDRRHGSVARR